jgi:hypothetical protein
LILLWRGIKFDHQGLFHTTIIDLSMLYCQERRVLVSSAR